MFLYQESQSNLGSLQKGGKNIAGIFSGEKPVHVELSLLPRTNQNLHTVDAIVLMQDCYTGAMKINDCRLTVQKAHSRRKDLCRNQICVNLCNIIKCDILQELNSFAMLSYALNFVNQIYTYLVFTLISPLIMFTSQHICFYTNFVRPAVPRPPIDIFFH